MFGIDAQGLNWDVMDGLLWTKPKSDRFITSQSALTLLFYYLEEVDVGCIRVLEEGFPSLGGFVWTLDNHLGQTQTTDHLKYGG